MRKAHYKQDYPRGYRLSNGSRDGMEDIPFIENWYAFAIALIRPDYSIERACHAMGIRGTNSMRTTTHQRGYVHQIKKLSYILNLFCGMKQRDIAKLLGTNQATIFMGVKYARSEGIKDEKV